MKKNVKYFGTQLLFFSIRINDNKKLKNNNKYSNKIILNIQMKRNIILYFNLIILLICIPLSKESFHLKKLNGVQEIIITVSGPGEVKILNPEYNNYPDEIYIDGSKYNGFGRYYFTTDFDRTTYKLVYYNTPSSFANMFDGLNELVKVDFSNCDTSNVSDMSKMFQNCKNLEEIDFTNFKTSSVLTMEGMFTACEKLGHLDVSNFDTSSVSNMVQMFCDCQSLQSIDLTSFIINNVNMDGMFNYCLNLESVSFSNTNTLGVNSMAGTFQSCKKLTSIDCKL